VEPSLEKLRDIVRQALKHVAATNALIPRERIEEEVRLYAKVACPNIDEGGVDAVVSDLARSFNVWNGRAGTLRGSDPGHKEWLSGRLGEIDWRFWRRYRAHLEEHLPQKVVEELHHATDDVLGLLEDPRRGGAWRRQGLVVGHVQSGKTANYTGLISKAADSGYKVIVVLSGMHNSLRSQTQIRLDEGFLGYARPFDGTASHGTLIGVGLIDPSATADTATTRDERGDFRSQVATNFQIHAGGHPLLFVVKKNKSVLSHLLTWAKLNARTPTQGGQNVVDGIPLLVIDDEADQASVDTNFQAFDEEGRPDAEHEPATINRLIRQLLSAFSQAAYVGYTATPFANVFVHPRASLDAIGPDLFPRDFIVSLAPPDDYFGPDEVFGGEDDELPPIGRAPSRVRYVTDAGAWVPPNHKSDLAPRHEGKDKIPPSLEEAVRQFILGGAIRRVRGQDRAHMSMLVHVTRYTAVQKAVHGQVDRLIEEYRTRWRTRTTTAGDTLKEDLRNLFERDVAPTAAAHGGSTPLWEAVEREVQPFLDKLKVNLINAKASDALIYEEHAQTGLCVIAIGGDKLSRGLTLEGLSVSYFLRSARMYDTLMQMGRWFGYRHGYDDLCRLFVSEELAGWYAHITLANEELRAEFDNMVVHGGTPNDYGLRVRSHPVLAVTGKLRPGTREVRLSLSATPFEPTVFREEAIPDNWLTTQSFLGRLGAPVLGKPYPDGGVAWRAVDPGAFHWRDVAANDVLTFLESFRFADDALVRTPPTVVRKYIAGRAGAGELSSWTVVLLGKPRAKREEAEAEFSIAGAEQVLVTLKRARDRVTTGTYVVKRVGSPDDEAMDLSSKERAEVEKTIARCKAENRPAREWTRGRLIREGRPKERGLLILYALTPPAQADGKPGVEPMIAPYISFPSSPDAGTISYYLNDVYWDNELTGIE
jgi:hypothetical protein